MNIFKENRGFTLIEIIVVIAVIGIGIVPMLNYFSNSISHIHDTEIRSQAVSIGGDVIELIKQESSEYWVETIENKDYSNDSSYSGSEEEAIWSNISDKYDLLAADFVLDVSLSDFGGSGEIQELTVEISWDSDNKSEEVITLIRNKEGGSSGS
jgi:prepilin-type N-terminal cleavage/methylation domain-containing protein